MADRVKVDRECPRCRVRAYHWGNDMGVPHRIRCARCGHVWAGRIRADEQAADGVQKVAHDYVAAVDAQNLEARRLEMEAPEMLAILQWMFPAPGMQRNPTDEIYARALAVIAKVAGTDGVGEVVSQTPPPLGTDGGTPQ